MNDKIDKPATVGEIIVRVAFVFLWLVVFGMVGSLLLSSVLDN